MSGTIRCSERANVCQRCCCVDWAGREGVRKREDVTRDGIPARLCNFCYGRVTGTIADPMEGLE